MSSTGSYLGPVSDDELDDDDNEDECVSLAVVSPAREQRSLASLLRLLVGSRVLAARGRRIHVKVLAVARFVVMLKARRGGGSSGRRAGSESSASSRRAAREGSVGSNAGAAGVGPADTTASGGRKQASRHVDPAVS